MNVKKSTIRTWSRLGQRGSVFGIGFPELASQMKNIKLVTADLSLLSGMERYIKEFPDKFLNVGIAEQNMIGIAAGLAMEGNCVFATTYASFITTRSLEQIRQNLAHMGCNVKVIGTAAGVVAAKSGVSHWATEDIAFIRALPNMQLFSPADALEAMKIVEYSTGIDMPAYIRLSGGMNCPIIYHEDFEFIPGKAVTLREGEQLVVVATGLMVNEALQAADILAQQGISTKVINFNTIKPLDTEILDEIFEQYPVIVSVEEHSVIGGLGSAIAEYMSEKAHSSRLLRIGFHDFSPKAGSQRYVWEQAGLTAEKIANRIMVELD